MPGNELEHSTAELIGEARAQVSNQIQIATSLDARGLGMVAGAIALLGAILSDRPTIRLDLGPDLVLTVWALLLASVVWLLVGLGRALVGVAEYSRGPDVGSMYDEFGLAPPVEFNRGLLEALKDSVDYNRALAAVRRRRYQDLTIRLAVFAALSVVYLAVVR